jgi:membrane protein implicated in regulation of membrane protease activity
LYRGLFIVAVLQTVSAVASSLASSNWRHEVFVILVASMLAFLMCRRARRFYAYTEERVLQIFYLGMKDTPHEKT